MFRSKFVVPALSVVCLLASQAVVPAVASASTLRVSTNTSVQPLIHSKSKMVDINIANNTGSVLEVKVGDTPMKIESGQTVKVSGPAGTKIIVTASSNHEVGSTLAELTNDLAGATLRVR